MLFTHPSYIRVKFFFQSCSPLNPLCLEQYLTQCRCYLNLYGVLQRPTVFDRELHSMLCGSLDGKGVRGKWMHLYI